MKQPFFILLLICSALSAFAGSAMFGTDDNIHSIQDVNITSPNDLPMQLAHRVSLHFFVAGIYTSDEGYVLIEKGKNEQYWDLTSEMVKEFQADGTLPNPLPKYKIPVWDYLFGYSLWLIIAGMALFYWLKSLITKMREPKEEKNPFAETEPAKAEVSS